MYLDNLIENGNWRVYIHFKNISQENCLSQLIIGLKCICIGDLVIRVYNHTYGYGHNFRCAFLESLINVSNKMLSLAWRVPEIGSIVDRSKVGLFFRQKISWKPLYKYFGDILWQERRNLVLIWQYYWKNCPIIIGQIVQWHLVCQILVNWICPGQCVQDIQNLIYCPMILEHIVQWLLDTFSND